MNDETAQGIPRLVLRERAAESVRVLRSLQALVLEHPVAAQAAFSALVAEGRAYASTDSGREWQERLTRSALLHRARLVFEVGTLWMLDDEPPGPLPSAYLDAVFMSAGSERMEPILNQLFGDTLADGDAE
jgi:hypothetical protein